MFKIYSVNFYLIIVVILFFSSCITNKDLDVISTKDNINLSPSSYDYTFQPGDLLSVQISTTTELNYDFFNKEQNTSSQLLLQNPYLYGYLVNNDGNLNLPAIGLVKAEGFTKSELENIISKIAIDFFESPVVKVNIINFEVKVIGEVNSPGLKKINKSNPDILHCIGLASGFTNVANKKNIKIIRNNSEGRNVFTFNLSDSKSITSKDYYILPNDVIYVAPLKKRFYAFNNLPQFISVGISSITLFLLLTNN